MKRNYYHVSVLKDTSGIPKETDKDAATYHAERIASKRQRVKRTGQWFTKLIGQTPKRWVFRVRFDFADWY